MVRLIMFSLLSAGAFIGSIGLSKTCKQYSDYGRPGTGLLIGAGALLMIVIACFFLKEAFSN